MMVDIDQKMDHIQIKIDQNSSTAKIGDWLSKNQPIRNKMVKFWSKFGQPNDKIGLNWKIGGKWIKIGQIIRNMAINSS